MHVHTLRVRRHPSQLACNGLRAPFRLAQMHFLSPVNVKDHNHENRAPWPAPVRSEHWLGAGQGRGRGARRVPRARGHSEGSLPSLLIQDFAQKALWGLEQQRMHHTVFKTSSFKSKLFKKRTQFLIGVRYRDAGEPYLLEGHMVYRWWRVPRGAVGGICFLNTQKAQPQAVINTSKSDLTIKINIQKNLSVHTSERVSNTFTQKNNKGFVHRRS